MAITKLQAESLNLADDFTFTGTVAGAGGITEADVFRVNSGFTGDASPITSNWERADDASSGLIGTGMTQSSGVFTFPSTGIYLVKFVNNSYSNADDRSVEGAIYVSTDGGSTYDQTSAGTTHIKVISALNTGACSSAECIIDVTNTSNVKITFHIFKANSATTTWGDSGSNRVYAIFVRLGDT